MPRTQACDSTLQLRRELMTDYEVHQEVQDRLALLQNEPNGLERQIKLMFLSCNL